jgi:hypothetical protein
MFALFSPRRSGIALLILYMWLSLIPIASGADQVTANLSCLHPSEPDIVLTSDLTPAALSVGLGQDMGVDDRADTFTSTPLLFAQTLSAKTAATAIARQWQAEVVTHGNAWPQAPPGMSV